MSKRQSFKSVRSGSVIGWADRESGAVAFDFDISRVAPGIVDRVFAYGCRQIIADAAAPYEGIGDKVAAMRARAHQLIVGSWGERAARLVDADGFAAAVAAGLIPDDEAARAKWTALTGAQRRAIIARPDVQAHMSQPSGDNTDDILSSF